MLLTFAIFIADVINDHKEYMKMYIWHSYM